MTNMIQNAKDQAAALAMAAYKAAAADGTLPEAEVKTAPVEIPKVHVADNDRWFVGHGHYDFAETLGALKEIGYTGAVSVESFGFPDMISSARASYENMRHIMNQL